MKFGVMMFTTDYSMTPMELAIATEDLGFESLWFPEHSHIPLSRKSQWPAGGDLPKMYYDVMDPFVGLAAAVVNSNSRILKSLGYKISREKTEPIPAGDRDVPPGPQALPPKRDEGK